MIADHHRVLTARFQHPIALLFKNLADKLAHHLIVFHQQNSFRAGSGCRGRMEGKLHTLSLLHQRQINFEGSTVSHLAIYPDMPATLLDNAMHHRHAEARPLTLLLGSEKRLKYTGL